MKKYIVTAPIMLIIVIVAYLVLDGSEFDWTSFLLNILPVALFSFAILHSHRIHRMMARCTTCSRALVFSIWVYMLEVFLPYFIVTVCTFIGITPFSSIIVFLTLPVSIACAKTIKNSIGGGSTMIADLDQRTANLQLIFSILLTIAFMVSRLCCVF